jgi:cell division inhibitor SulA
MLEFWMNEITGDARHDLEKAAPGDDGNAIDLLMMISDEL